jgi:hypothetical protein
MSEDKLRAQFEVWYEADSMPSESNWFKRDDQYPDEYHYLATQISWGGFQSCAKIKDAEIEQLNAELERERMRLSACGIVALANTEESATKARLMHDDYRSASCDDVARMVDVQMKLRTQVEQLNAKVAMMSEVIKEIWYSNSTQIEETKFYEIIKATEADVTKWVNGMRANAVVEYLIQVQEAREAQTLRGELRVMRF